MSLISSIYHRSNERIPRQEADAERTRRKLELLEETRAAVAFVLQVQIADVPATWRKMAMFAQPGRRHYRRAATARILDEARIRAGLEPEISQWLNHGGGDSA